MSQLLVVYTAIIGVGCKDQLWGLNLPPDIRGRRVQYVCFSDSIRRGPHPWRIETLQWQHDQDARRTARWHKIVPHRLFPEADFTLWHDGSHQLTVNPWTLVDTYLANDSRHVAVPGHCERNCVYQELNGCVRRRKDNEQVMRQQIDRYKAEGYPDANGLYETGVLLRRNSKEMSGLNEMWWHEVRDGSCRDQLSFPYVLWRSEIKPTVIPGCGHRGTYFVFHPHR